MSHRTAARSPGSLFAPRCTQRRALALSLVFTLGCGASGADTPSGVTDDVTVEDDGAVSGDTAGQVLADVATPDVAEQPDLATPSDTATVNDSGADVPGADAGPTVCVGSCDDGDLCTTDGCVDGACEHVVDPLCCKAVDPCDDGIACTVDSCNPVLHRCQHNRSSNTCCVTSDDCDDFDGCTADTCVANQCLHARSADSSCQCVASLQCDDGNPCTKDQCSQGACVYTALSSPECCADAAACDDGLASTSDGCQLGLCWHALAIGCTSDTDCVSTNGCIAAQCDAGLCRFDAAPGCCVSHLECADGWEDTSDSCSAQTCLHIPPAPAGGACASTADCTTPNSCATATCVADAGVCSLAAVGGEGCCVSAADCPASTTCAAWSCALGLCVEVPTGGEEVLWAATFDDGTLAGFTTQGTSPSVFWQLTTVDALSAPNALYYGRLPQNDYDAGATSGTATSPDLVLPAAPSVLRFDRKLAVEPGQVNDKVWITVDESGQAPVSIWDKTYNQGPGIGWKHVDVDLSAFAGKTVRLTIHFDSVDEKLNGGSYTGAYFDNLVVAVPCL